MNKLVIVVFAVSLLAGSALAEKVDSREGPGIRPAWSVDKSPVLENFEGAFPPVGWTHGVADPTNTWQQSTLTSYSGLASACIHWQANMHQDETLSFAWPVAAGEDLFFATIGSVYWSARANFTVEVNGAEVYNFRLQAGASWVWRYPQIDLAPWEGTTPVFTFRYHGQDGADHYLDAVHIGSGAPPPPASFCQSVIVGTGTSFTGDTCDGPWYLTSNARCNVNYSVFGREHYYEIVMPANCTFTANVVHSGDGVLWLLDSCEIQGGIFPCLGFADNTWSGAETLTYMNATGAAQVVYLAIDSYASDLTCGAYTFEFLSDCAVATESESFGAVKAMFR